MASTLETLKEIFLPRCAMCGFSRSLRPSWACGGAFNEMFQLGHSLGDEKYMFDT